MKKIGVIAAMQEELNALIALLQNHRKEILCGPYHVSTPVIEWHFGQLESHSGPVEIVALQSGVGKAQAGMRTGLLLQLHGLEYLVNIGSAGGLMAPEEPEQARHGDIVIAETLAYYDVDVQTFGYQYGQLPGSPQHFVANPALKNAAQKIARELFKVPSHSSAGENTEAANRVYAGQIVSGDSFVEHGSPQLERIQQHFPDALAVEMEAAAIAHIAFLFGCPALFVRSISDFPNRPDGKIDFQQYLPLAASNAARLVARLATEYPHL